MPKSHIQNSPYQDLNPSLAGIVFFLLPHTSHPHPIPSSCYISSQLNIYVGVYTATHMHGN